MANLVRGEGPVPCKAMIIGEAPGVDEDTQGRPFVGRSGELLEEALAICGVTREQVYITNVYKYRPPGNRAPTEKEISSHAMILHKELTDVKPKIVLTLGATASGNFITLDKGIVRQRGLLRTVGDMVILPTIHPSYVLRDRNKRFELFLEDVRLFTKVAQLHEKGVKSIDCNCGRHFVRASCPKHGDDSK